MTDACTIVGDSADRTAWLRLRATGVGASEAAALVGESPWLTVAGLWARKRAAIDGAEDESETPERFEWGLRHEPSILDAYASERYAGRASERAGRLLRSSSYPWAVATLDAWTQHPEHGRIPLELKTSEVYHADEWRDGCPRHYWWQLQHQMLVTGAPCASIACLLGVHRLVWDDVEWDDAAIARLVYAGARFWDRVERGELPPGPLDARDLATIYPRDDGSVVELGGEWIEIDEERVGLHERRAVIETRLDAIDGELRGAIGRASTALLPNGVSYTLRADKRGRRVLRRRAAKEERTRAWACRRRTTDGS